MSYDDYYNYFDIEGCNQQIDIEQLGQFDREQQNSQNGQQFIQILDPNNIEDSGFVFLLQEASTSQLEEAMLQDVSMFFNREAKLFNYLANLFQLTDLDMQGAPEYTNQLTKLLKMFFQIHEIGQHSDFSYQLAQQYGLKDFRTGYPFGFIINSDQSLILLLLKIILSEENLNKENDFFSQIRMYLPRYLIFSINPPKPFVSRTQVRSLQNSIINKINYELFDTNFAKPYKLDLLALSYFSDPGLNFQLFKETIEILRSTLESLLEQKNTQQDINREIQNLLQFFLAFTTNQEILKSFFQINFHKTLYNNLRQCQIIFGCNNPPLWSKEPIIIEQIVSLIVRILSFEQVDKQFIDILHEDFMLLLQHQKLDLIYKVLLPILNSEQVKLVAVCFHPKLSVSESKAETEKFLSNQTKTMAGSTTLVTELLTKNQCDKITQLVQENLNKSIQKQQQQQNVNKIQIEKQQMELEYNDQAMYDLFSDEFQIEKIQFAPLNLIQQQQVIPVQQNIINENQRQIIGSWIHLHSFSPFNPHFDSQILTKVLDNRTNVLFIFEMMVGQENVKLVCFVNHLIQDGRRQNYVQARSNESSFYLMMVQDEHFWYVNALDGKPHVLLDIQQHMVQISHHNEPIACINFSDFQQSKFGFPFKKLQEKTLLMDQINAALQGLECYLLQIAIYTFDVNKDNLFEDDVQSLKKKYEKQMNYYYSQLRMQTIQFIPNTITGQDLSQFLNENIEIDQLKENSINDIDVIKPVTQQIQIKSKQQKSLLTYFEQKIGGIFMILDYVKKYLDIVQASKQYKDLIFELTILCQIEGFQEMILQSEGFLQQLLALAYLNKKQECKEIYQKINSLIYSQLVQLIQEKPFLKIVMLLEHKLLEKIVNKTEQQLNLINQNTQPQAQVKFEQPKMQFFKKQSVNQGKPKGIGYGDIEYKGFKYINEQQQFNQKQQKEQQEGIINQLDKKQNNQDINLENLLNCLIQLLDLEFINVRVLESIQQSNIMNLLSKYLQNVNITTLEGSKTFNKILQIIECLAQRELTLQLFISKENTCLFRQLESFNQQVIIFIKTFNSKIEELNKFMKLYQYVENCLYAAKLITIKYLSQGQQNDIDVNINMHQFYRPFMKKLAVGKCEIKTDADYLLHMKEYYQQTNNPSQNKMQKLISEITTIEENLPLEATNSIFLRYDNDRMDCMRTIIFGASGTPYAHGAFLYDMFFGDDYPQRPPKMKLATTGHGKVRFNPNLYNCGKVCLSLLGTWGDNWIANFSTILQILVSVQSMVMSEYVMFNEPGWESQMGTPNGEQANRGYCNFIKIQNIRYAMIEQLQNPPKGFEEVIKKSFYLRKDLIMKEIEQWIEQANLPATYNQTQNQCTYTQQPLLYKQDLIKIYEELKVELEKLKFNIGKDFQTISNEKKKEIIFNLDNIQPQKQYQIMNKKVMPQGLNINEIDISYNNNVQQRQFDSNDQNLQNLMSRYIGVVGLDAVKKQSESTIFIHILNGLGIEIAKNIVLSGVKRLILFDPQLVQMSDLGSNFYLTEQDINKRRDFGILNKLKHLNPYVKIDVLENNLDELNLDEIQVFVTQDPTIASIASNQNKHAVVLAQTRNIFVRIITDFGNEFTIVDKDGEQLSEVNIENISNNVVTIFKNQNHNLTENDLVLIQEVKQEQGIGESYNQVFQIKNVKRQSFELVTNRQFTKYLSHGVAYQQKQPIKLQFDRIQKVISSLDHYCDNIGTFDGIDKIKRDIIHFCMNTTSNDLLTNNWDIDKIKMFIISIRQQNLREILNFRYQEDVLFKYQEELLSLLTLLSINTQFQPLCALVGGMAAQEVLKAINKKYTPIHQAYVQSFEDILPFKLKEFNFAQIGLSNNLEININKYQECMQKFGFKQNFNTRYNDLENTIGNTQKIFNAEVFVVGAGAIGCELLKNYAMLGISKSGKIYVTDPDIIENSNLSRQFLFREKHIRKPKSLTAAAVVKQMNPDINIVARLDKVCQETQDIYNNYFYTQMNCVTNALDNVQARLFIDSKCVENKVSLIESGTLGPKGHVQSIIPDVTESYASKQDPEQNNDIPYCTLRMFPESNIHCLEWARDKFEQYFFRKPQALVQLMQDPSPQQQTVDLAIKVLKKYPTTFQQCVQMGRLKFQKLFNHDIIALMNAYPLNSLTKEGKLFWAPPKRPPKPIEFNSEFAFKFVEDFALLTAQIYNIGIPRQYDINKLIQNVQIPKMNIKKNKIQEIVEKQDKNNQLQQMEEEVKNYDQLIKEARQLLSNVKPILPQPQQFEKDDDTNHHVSFITAATNGRAINYGIQQVDWMWTKLKAGRIIPAMATTTSCIAALQTLELIKILQNSTQYRNTFLNLAIPFMMQSEPGEVDKFQLKNGLNISIWTKLNLKIKRLTEPLQYIVNKIEEMIGDEINSLQQGAKVFYMKQMLPKDEEEKYNFINTPIYQCIQFINDSSQINVQINDNKSLVVLITLV
ncbi:unnamed protein product [Paramecium pentaurelia]|uniref:UBC core domain-containing protein n=1 Tax=Paramecium pentaurelia TaxID=43138 RepID=A0A8S1Y458_9CILI|nr:unnamed protein product [Paramecium pentaurelia]